MISDKLDSIIARHMIGRMSDRPEHIAIAAIEPPMAKEPESPIKTFAGYVLKQRKAIRAPADAAAVSIRLSPPSRPKTPSIGIKAAKSSMEQPASSPSHPSRRFEEFTTATRINAITGR